MVVGLWHRDTQRRRRAARRFFWNTEDADERITTDFWPLCDHYRFSAIIGVTWSDADDINTEVRLSLLNPFTVFWLASLLTSPLSLLTSPSDLSLLPSFPCLFTSYFLLDTFAFLLRQLLKNIFKFYLLGFEFEKCQFVFL